MKEITASQKEHLDEAIAQFKGAKKIFALTGAGISVESGIDDFRSPGGIWQKYPPEEYGTLAVFRKNPEKAWELFRTLGKKLLNKKPNEAHRVLAKLEKEKMLQGIVTQNIDNLHQDAGSQIVLEIHGNHHFLHCIGCGDVSEPSAAILRETNLPRCKHCGHVLKPDVVLFGENVRSFDEINAHLYNCDLLMVIGTSAQVYPAASFPEQVKNGGGLLFEFNTDQTVLTTAEYGASSDFFFCGRASAMLQVLFKGLQV